MAIDSPRPSPDQSLALTLRYAGEALPPLEGTVQGELASEENPGGQPSPDDGSDEICAASETSPAKTAQDLIDQQARGVPRVPRAKKPDPGEGSEADSGHD